MGMTIETSICNLSMYDVNECGNAELHTWYKDVDKDMKDSFNVAIDTMRKYQKIREIAFPLQFCTTDKLNHEAIMKICEVLEDGNDD